MYCALENQSRSFWLARTFLLAGIQRPSAGLLDLWPLHTKVSSKTRLGVENVNLPAGLPFHSRSGCISRNTVLRRIIVKVWKKRIGVESASSFLHGYLVARSGFEPTSPGLHSPHSLSLPSSVSPGELFLCHPLKAWLLPPQLCLASVCLTSCLFLSVLCSQTSFPCVLVMRQCAASPIVWAQSSTRGGLPATWGLRPESLCPASAAPHWAGFS